MNIFTPLLDPDKSFPSQLREKRNDEGGRNRPHLEAQRFPATLWLSDRESVAALVGCL